jgi:hypothetical protein
MKAKLLISIVVIIYACNPISHKRENENNINNQEIITQTIYKRGIINTLTIPDNINYSYSFYLPNDSLPKYPIFILLDPHAKGTFVVSLYQQLAEKYNVILLSSNYIRNSMPQIQIEQILNAILKDISKFLPIDTNRIYIGGFSGMARAVYNLISNSTRYKGAVAIGAGANFQIPWKDSTFCLIQMCGFKDMNFHEVFESNQIIKNVSYLYMAFYYDDIHQWPIDTIMEFAWINFFPNKSNISHFIKSYYNFAKNIPLRDAWKKTLLLSGLRYSCYHLKYYEYPFNEINNYLNKIESKNSLKQLQNILKTERKEMEELSKNFIEKDSLWWKKTISHYLQIKNKTNLSPYDYKDIRIANYIGLLAYYYTKDALNQNRMDLAKKFLSIYSQIEPFNSDMLYFWSIYYAKLNKYTNSIDSLSKAIKFGFSDKLMIQNELSFNNIRDSVRFLDIVNKIK